MKILVLLLVSVCSAAPNRKGAQLEFLRGQLLERKGAYPEALDAYERALDADPNSAFVNREAAELALETGDPQKALGWAERAAALAPKDAPTLQLLGRVQWALGETELARKSFESALKLDPGSSESIYALSTLMAVTSPDKARDMLTRFLEQNPSEAAEAHFQLAKIERQQGHMKAALKHLQQGIALDPDEGSLPARYALAEAYESERSTEAALAEYEKIRKLEPQNVALLDHIAQIHFIKGDFEPMREVLLEAKSVQRDDATANHWLAILAENKKDWAAAAGYLRDSAALAEEPGLSLRLSYYLTQAGRVPEAVKVLETAHERWPNNDQVSYFLALGYDDLKRDREAVALLRQVLALKPASREARYQLAILLERGGRLEEAEKEFRVLLADRPDDASVLNYLGYSLADRGLKLDEAEGYIRRAVALEPGNGAYLDSLGWVQHKAGRSKEGVASLRKAVEALPEDDTVWDHLGDALAAAGEDAAAWRAWKRSEALVSGPATLPRKAEKLEKEFEPEAVGAMYLGYLREVQGGLKKLGGLCELRGRILGRDFSFPCMMTFADGELSLDLLGPMFSPLFRMKLGEQGFTMDPLRIEGVDPQAVDEGAFTAMRLMRAYLAGRLFDDGPAVYKKTWRGKRLLERPLWTLRLDRASVRVEQVTPTDADQYRLCLQEFGRTDGRQLPRKLTVAGKGFELSVRFNDVKAEFDKRP